MKSGFGKEPGFSYFVDSEIGMTMGDAKIEVIHEANGGYYFKATAPIGTLFGHAVNGECKGIGPTRELALEALAEDRKHLSDSLWA